MNAGKPGSSTIHVLLIDDFADWEPALVLSELARRGRVWRPVTVGLERGKVRSMGGLVVEIERGLDEVDPASVRALMVIGSSVWEEREIPAVSRFLREVWQGGATVGAICGGTLAAAHAGLLEGRRHATNGPDYIREKLPAERLGKHVEAPAVRDGRLITAPAIGYVEFSAELVAAIGAMPEEEKAGWIAYVKSAGKAA
jgi:putative intracellular protease/amidase